MQSDILIAAAQPEHVPAIAALEAACFSCPNTEDMICAHLERYTAALKDGEVLGYSTVTSVLDECSLDNIAVLPACRRQGIARLLMGAMIADARQRKMACIRLEVRQSNVPAVTMYKQYGFRVDGVRKNYYTKPREDAILMTLVL